MQIELSKIKVLIPERNQPSTKKPLFAIKTFKVNSGEKVLIHGPSGKGKTTLLHLMAGLFTPDEGTVTFDNLCLNTLSSDARASLRREKIGFVFQKLNLFDYLTVEENVMLGMRTITNAKEKALSALEAVAMKDRSRDLSGVLSLGEQQRVAVARVLASAPELILADEPTSSLDEKNAHLVLDSLFKAAGDKSLVMVSHDHRIRDRFEKTVDFEELTAQ